MITQEELKEILHYCPESGVFTWLVSKGRAKKSNIAGSYLKTHGKTYIRIRVRKRLYLAHRLAFLYMTGSFPEKDTDHEDGDGTNNKWLNLKSVTNQENQKNRRLYKCNKTGHTGVTCRGWGRYHARIRVNSKHIHLGCFTNIDDAIIARKSAEVQYGFHANHGSNRPL